MVSDSRFESSEGCQWLWSRYLVLVADFVDFDRGGESVHAVDLLVDVPREDDAQGAECRSPASATERRMYSLPTLCAGNRKYWP